MDEPVLEIEPLFEVDGGPLMGFYARGHHGFAVFLRALLAFIAEEGYEDKLLFGKRGPGFYPNLRVLDVSQIWWRTVPYCGGEGMELHKAEPHSRGAFRVMVWETP